MGQKLPVARRGWSRQSGVEPAGERIEENVKSNGEPRRANLELFG